MNKPDIIPLMEFQNLVLVKDSHEEFEKKLWEVVHKYIVVYVKVYARYKNLTEEYDE